jgi:hypothetical protein
MGRSRGRRVGSESPSGRRAPVAAVDDMAGCLAGGDGFGCAGSAVSDLDCAAGEASADDDDGGDADQLGVFEFHPGGNVGSVVVEHPDVGGGQLGDQTVGELGDRLALANCDEVNVSLWLATSASAGSSRNVRRKSSDIRSGTFDNTRAP